MQQKPKVPYNKTTVIPSPRIGKEAYEDINEAEFP